VLPHLRHGIKVAGLVGVVERLVRCEDRRAVVHGGSLAARRWERRSNIDVASFSAVSNYGVTRVGPTTATPLNTTVLDAIATRSAGATNGLNAQSSLTGTSISSPPN
jgi:hypothetical protein